jgi:hypothetical protein
MRISQLLLVGVGFCACDKYQGLPSGLGFEESCTSMGCVDGLHIVLEKATLWPAGNYTFAFELDGVDVTCKGSLPLKACGSGLSMSCEPAGKVHIGESGCAMPPEAHGFTDIQLAAGGSPRAVKLTILAEDQPLHEARLTPQYRSTRPNGEDCEPVCNSASETVRLP